MTVDILLFTGNFLGHMKSSGAYRVATEMRKHGYSVQVVDLLPQLIETDVNRLWAIIDKFVGASTIWVGFSSTFLLDRRAATHAIKSGKMTAVQVDENKNFFNGSLIPLSGDELDELRKRIKLRSPRCKIVLGGARAHLKSCHIVDVYVEGYADSTVLEMTRWMQGKHPFFQFEYNRAPQGTGRYWSQSVSVTHDPKASRFDFNNSDIRWEKQDCVAQGEALPIEISRGCIFNCSFCSYPLNGKKKLDFIKDPKVLRDEFQRNFDNYGTTRYVYADDTHNDSVEKLQRLYDDVYSKLPFKVEFFTYLRLDLLAAHPDTIPLLRESGLRGAFFGIESLNYPSAKAIGKGIRPERALETLHAVKRAWGTEVKTSAGFIVGLPHETVETAQDWLNDIVMPEFPLDCVHIYPLFIANNPGSKVWKSELELNAEKYGYKFPPGEPWQWYNEHMNFEEAKLLVKQAMKYAALNRKRKMSDFALPGLMNLGYDWNDLLTIQNGEFGTTGIHERQRAFVENYYEAVMAV